MNKRKLDLLDKFTSTISKILKALDIDEDLIDEDGALILFSFIDRKKIGTREFDETLFAIKDGQESIIKSSCIVNFPYNFETFAQSSYVEIPNIENLVEPRSRNAPPDCLRYLIDDLIYDDVLIAQSIIKFIKMIKVRREWWINFISHFEQKYGIKLKYNKFRIKWRMRPDLDMNDWGRLKGYQFQFRLLMFPNFENMIESPDSPMIAIAI